MLVTDHDGNGLVEYALSGNSGSWPEQLKYRPANWWDTIGFGHEDAYANALAYRALNGMEELARQSGHPMTRPATSPPRTSCARLISTRSTIRPRRSGGLAERGWPTARLLFPLGQRHCDPLRLVPKDKANGIMDRLLAKMKEVGYTRFDLGLPGNLIPVARKDYVDHDPRFGGGTNEDNSDGFQRYENGGATGCYAYFTLAALYDLGRIEEADKMLFPMLGAIAQGRFRGVATMA